MNAVAAALRSALPTPIRIALRDAVQGSALRLTRKRSFEPARLRGCEEVSLGDVFADTMVTARYREDHEEISSLLGTAGELHDSANPGDRRAIYHLVASLKPERVLEIGTHIGTSALYIAGALRAFSSFDARVTTVDIVDVNGPTGPWSRLGLPMRPAALCETLGLGKQVVFETASSLKKLAAATVAYDLVFLDGDHSPVAVYQEISLALRCLSPGGLILLHDYYPIDEYRGWDGPAIRGPWAAAARIRRENAGIVFVPFGTLPWLTKGDSHFTSLALVMKP